VGDIAGDFSYYLTKHWLAEWDLDRKASLSVALEISAVSSGQRLSSQSFTEGTDPSHCATRQLLRHRIPKNYRLRLAFQASNSVRKLEEKVKGIR
jgi:hypothetical protein